MEVHGLFVSLPVLRWQLWGWRQSETPWFGFAARGSPTVGKYYCHGPSPCVGCSLNPSCAVSCSPRREFCVGIPCPHPLLGGSWRQHSAAGPSALLDTTVCTPVSPHTSMSTHWYVCTPVRPHTGTSAAPLPSRITLVFLARLRQTRGSLPAKAERCESRAV